MKRYSARSILRSPLKVGRVLMLLEAGTLAFAQEPASPPVRRAPTQALAREQPDNLVAPITLYPDCRLSQELVASDPLEVVEAQDQQNGSLRGAEVRTDAAHSALILLILNVRGATATRASASLNKTCQVLL